MESTNCDHTSYAGSAFCCIAAMLPCGHGKPCDPSLSGLQPKGVAEQRLRNMCWVCRSTEECVGAVVLFIQEKVRTWKDTSTTKGMLVEGKHNKARKHLRFHTHPHTKLPWGNAN
eukprot:1162005-Pelagomonas_calceolata.AAC.3